MAIYYVEVRTPGAIGTFGLTSYHADSSEHAIEQAHADGFETRGAGTKEDWNRNGAFLGREPGTMWEGKR